LAKDEGDMSSDEEYATNSLNDRKNQNDMRPLPEAAGVFKAWHGHQLCHRLGSYGGKMGTSPNDNGTETRSGRQFSRRTALRQLGGAGLAMTGAGHLAGAAGAAPNLIRQGEERPNILVIMVDEMRDWQWFPDQSELNVQLPAMARLQEGAVRFGRHYTASNMCTAARGCLLTGLYSHQTGVLLTQGGSAADLRGEATPTTESVPPQPGLDPRLPTWGTMLRDQGYETYWYGKWHLNEECGLEPYGFAGGTCPSPDGGPGQGQSQDPNIADQAINWLDSQGERGPWCTTVSFVNPHDVQWYPRWTRQLEGQNDPPSVFQSLPPNWETPSDLIAQNKPRLQLVSEAALPQVFGALPHHGPGFERGWLELQDLYLQLHGYVDQEIGRVLDALEQQPEVAARTIIVFTADHGEYAGAHGMRGKGAALYEEGIRVPFWVKDPTGRYVSQPEVTRTQLTSSVDIAPMLLTMASGNEDWRRQPELSYLASRLHLARLLEDATAPGRSYALHATDEDGFEFGPRLFPFLQDAPFHVLGLVGDHIKLGVYTHWADDTTEIVTEGQEMEFYDYRTEEGRLELANSAGPENKEFNDVYGQLMNYAVPNELRSPLPDELEAAREATMAATLARVAYDRAAAQEAAGTLTQ
jgi:arylsulfatase A-like enzyme